MYVILKCRNKHEIHIHFNKNDRVKNIKGVKCGECVREIAVYFTRRRRKRKT